MGCKAGRCNKTSIQEGNFYCDNITKTLLGQPRLTKKRHLLPIVHSFIFDLVYIKIYFYFTALYYLVLIDPVTFTVAF